MMDNPARTPITIPAIAPPDSEDPDDEVVAAAAVDVAAAVVVGEVLVKGDVEVVKDVAVVGVGVSDADEEGSPLSMTWGCSRNHCPRLSSRHRPSRMIISRD